MPGPMPSARDIQEGFAAGQRTHRAQFIFAHFRVHHQQSEHAAATLESVAAHQLPQLGIGVVHQQVEVVGLGQLAEAVAGGRTDQGIEARPALALAVGLFDLLGQGLVGVLPALALGLFGAQFGAVLFCWLRNWPLQFGEGLRELPRRQVAIVLGLVVLQVLLSSSVSRISSLFDGFFAVEQALAQLADVLLVQAEQGLEGGTIQVRMGGAPLRDTGGQRLAFVVQGLQFCSLPSLEFGGQLHQVVASNCCNC